MHLDVSLFFTCIETKSRSSRWRQEKREREEAAAAGLDQPPLALSSKCYISGYTNLACLLNVTLAETGHAHYYGSWYCPYVPNPVPVEVWKAERMALLQAKKAARQQQYRLVAAKPK